MPTLLFLFLFGHPLHQILNETSDVCLPNPYTKSAKNRLCVCLCLSYLGLRGQSPDAIILEEAAFMDQKIFYEVVAPLMGNANVAVLGISTPNNMMGNYYNHLLNLKRPSGEPLFKIINLEMACQKCKEEGKAHECQHKEATSLDIPWLESDRDEMLQEIYKNNPEQFAQEKRGVQEMCKNFVINREWLEALKNHEEYRHLPDNVDVLFSAVDPAGGGKISDFVVVTTAHHAGKMIVRSLSLQCAPRSVLSRSHAVRSLHA